MFKVKFKFKFKVGPGASDWPGEKDAVNKSPISAPWNNGQTLHNVRL